MGLPCPAPLVAGGPAWLSLGQAFVDFDRQAWQVAYRRIQEAWALPGEDRKALRVLLETLTKRIPVGRRTLSSTPGQRPTRR